MPPQLVHRQRSGLGGRTSHVRWQLERVFHGAINFIEPAERDERADRGEGEEQSSRVERLSGTNDGEFAIVLEEVVEYARVMNREEDPGAQLAACRVKLAKHRVCRARAVRPAEHDTVQVSHELRLRREAQQGRRGRHAGADARFTPAFGIVQVRLFV